MLFLESEKLFLQNTAMKIAELIYDWRIIERLTLKQAAEQIGIPFQTLHRIEQGSKTEGRTLAVLLRWLLEE